MAIKLRPKKSADIDSDLPTPPEGESLPGAESSIKRIVVGLHLGREVSQGRQADHGTVPYIKGDGPGE